MWFKGLMWLKSILQISILFFLFSCASIYENKSQDNLSPHSLELKQESKPQGLVFPVLFYRKYISSVIGTTCPMYPCCSSYSLESFRKYGFIKGWIMTCDRLVRCGRDELKISDTIWIDGESRCYDPIENNDLDWSK